MPIMTSVDLVFNRLFLGDPPTSQLLGPRQLIKVPETKYLKKSLGCSVEERPSQFARPPSDTDQISLEQLAEDFAALHTAYRFDLGSEDRLAIGNNNQCLQGRCGETCLDR